MRSVLLAPIVAAGLLLISCGSDDTPKDETNKQTSPPASVPEVTQGSPEPGVAQRNQGQPGDEAVPGATRRDNPYPEPKNQSQQVKSGFALMIVAMREGDTQAFCRQVSVPKELSGLNCTKAAARLMPKLSKENNDQLLASYNVALERLKSAKVKIRGDKAVIDFGTKGLGSQVKMIQSGATWKVQY